MCKAGGAFPSTNWPLLSGSRRRTAAGCRDLEAVACLYMPALRRYLMFVKRLRQDEADDLVQSFLLDKLVSRRLLDHADQHRGRFRNLLVKALENYLRSKHRVVEVRRKRTQPLDMVADDASAASVDPAVAFERQWAESVLTRALAETREYLTKTGQLRVWQVFERRLVKPMIDGIPAAPYEELVREFGFATPLQAANVLTTAKRAFDRELRQLLSEGVPDGTSVDAELREFLLIFGVAAGLSGGRRR
jgi:hypothetical protein